MSDKKNKILHLVTDKKTGINTSRDILIKLLPLSGSEALNKLLAHDNSGALVKTISKMDLFWLIKKIGEDDAIPLLKLATNEQWQYILDMEIWKKDLIDITETFDWINRLYKADPERLSHWLYSEDGNLHAHFYFSKNLEVKIKDDEDFTPPKGFITFDNLHYIRILDEEHVQEIEQILRSMSLADYNRYQALLMGLAGVISAEIEEEMYRLKGVRLSETGYLPFEEAISVYAYQKADQLKNNYSEYELYYPEEDDILDLIPITPLIISGESNLFSMSVSGIDDHLVLERLRLEFAGLCNQILSADNTEFEGIEVLRLITRKTSGYINIGLEELAQGDINIAEKYIRNHPLISLFRVGFSLALELKWESEGWIKNAWFSKQDLDFGFWGDKWGGALEGLLKNKPLFYVDEKGDDNYRDFEKLAEIKHSRILLHRIILMDHLLEEITLKFPGIKDFTIDPTLDFYPIIFTFWARNKLLLEPGFIPLSLEEARGLFDLIRDEEKGPPYTMNKFEETFTIDMTSLLDLTENEDIDLFGETLSILWRKFSEEYAMVKASDLDAKFSRFILIQ